MQLDEGHRPLTVLGIESSCDETAAAVVRGRPGAGGEILAEALLSQTAEHAPYGGVVPEIAARQHVRHIDHLVMEAMERAGVGYEALDAVAATAGPGLIGGVIVGLMTGKGIAAATGKPLVAVNHLEGHALSPRIAGNAPFPYLLLLVSGGHCQLLAVEGVGRYRRLGTTIDDAAGEAFDKTAKLLGLGYPGGPAVERAAREGDPAAIPLPRPLLDRPGCDLSFSGLKTAVRRARETHPDAPVADIAAGFQAAVVDVLVEKSRRAMAAFRALTGQSGRAGFVVAGGVAANGALREELTALAAREGFDFVAPPLRLCTDNAAMIAWAGIERLALGLADPLTVTPRARWPLDADAPPAPGAGVKA